MAWRRPCDKPLSEPMMVSLLAHICGPRPQWVMQTCYQVMHAWNNTLKTHVHTYRLLLSCNFKWGISRKCLDWLSKEGQSDTVYLIKYVCFAALCFVMVILQSVVGICDLPLQWRHNEHDGFSNNRRLDCLLNRLSRHRSNETSKLRTTGLSTGNQLVNRGFSSQRASKAKMFPFYDVIVMNLSICFKSVPPTLG